MPAKAEDDRKARIVKVVDMVLFSLRYGVTDSADLQTGGESPYLALDSGLDYLSFTQRVT